MQQPLTASADEQLERRIRGEYVEMPGLQLTRAQAQRLFGLGARECATVLDDLVGRAFLVRRSNGRYARATDEVAGARSPRKA